ncbi:MAG: hypothetical protein OEY23_23255, partial [Acidimicrobiia bacterium]|nr:hypothetical protein [Acidimicrobiia bacterium]
MRSATVSRPRSGRTLGLLSAYVALLYLLPPRLVLRGPLGSAGRPAMVLGMGLAVLWWLGRLRPDDGGHRPTPTRWLIGGYLAAWCLSVAFAYERGLSPIESSGAERYLLLIGSLVGTALVVCDSIGDRATLDALLRRLTWAGALSGVIGLVQFRFKVNVAGWISAPGLRLDAPSGGLDTRGSSGFARALGTAGHPIEFAVLSALLLPLALHYALLSADRAQAQRRWTIVALVSLGVPLSVSRSGIVALALVAAVVLRLWRPAAQRVGWVVFGVSVVVLRL